MLVVRSQNTMTDTCGKGNLVLVLRIDGSGGQYSSGTFAWTHQPTKLTHARVRLTSLKLNLARLIKDPVENVFVVCHRDNCLQLQLPLAGDCCFAGSVVGMLPLNTCIHLVYANVIVLRHDFTVGVHHVTAEVGDQAETITSKGEIVGRIPSTNVPEVKCTFPVQRVARITIRHKHLGQRETEKHWTPVECGVVNHHPLAPVKT